MPFEWSGYVGIPWLDLGRDERGCDCWGLVRLVLQDGPGLRLPSFRSLYRDVADREAIAAIVGGARCAWRPVPSTAARPFDVVLLHADPWHVGAVVRPGQMLHMPEGRSSVIEPFALGRFGRRVEGVYRHEALA